MNIAGPYTLTVPALATAAEVDTGSLQGSVVAVGVKTADSGDLTILFSGDSARPDETVLNGVSLTGDAWFYPRPAVHDTDGAAIANTYAAGGVPIYGSLNIAIANATAGDEFSITLLLE